MDEKFSVNSFNGIAGYRIFLPFSKSRNYFTTSVSLSCSFRIRKWIFGLDWDIDLPSTSKKTELELPQY